MSQTSTRTWESRRMRPIGFSGIRLMKEEADRLERAGTEIVHLELGQPDFDTPVHIKEAAKRALDEGKTEYAHNYGILSLRQAIADKLREENGVEANPEDEIVVTAGAGEAVFLALLAFLEAGDEVIVPTPCWPNYVHAPSIADARAVGLPLRAEADFQIDADRLAGLVTPATKMVIVLTPHNPTGAVQRRGTLEAVAEVAQKHDLLVVSDEIYEKMVYDGAEHVSIASLPGMRERTITINGFSKAYAMTGWRIGYAAAPRTLTRAMIKVHQYVTGSVSHFGQYGATAALRSPQDCVREMVAEFARRRELVLRSLAAMPGVDCGRPEGAFYVFPCVKALGKTSEEIALRIVREAGVSLVPGSAFGPEGEGFLRITYANSYERIERAMERLARFFM